jgi:hypothetical protein
MLAFEHASRMLHAFHSRALPFHLLSLQDEDRNNNTVSLGMWLASLQLLLEMPTFGEVLATAPGGYVKLVSREMGKAEALLKVILSPVEGLCDTFRALLPDSPTADFKTVLDLKGLKKSEQTALTEEWSRRAGVASLSRPATSGTCQVAAKHGNHIAFLKSKSWLSSTVSSRSQPFRRPSLLCTC